MFKLVNLILSCLVLIIILTIVSAQNSTSLLAADDSPVDEARRRRKRFPFGAWGGHEVWWWGLKALSVLFTVKIKIVLLLLFLGGGIFYGLKIWQGNVLGCPEPIIQEIVKNHHDLEGILPYHGHISHDDISSYPGPIYSSPPSGYGSSYGDSLSGVYSNTPAAPYSGPTYLPPSGGGSYPSGSSDAAAAAASQQSYSYSSRRKDSTARSNDDKTEGRQISEESQTIFTDLIFRFLNVNSDQCRRRFVCELEYRNPFMGYAFKYIGVELFKEYKTLKEGKNAATKFTDCARLYEGCRAPNEQPLGVQKKRKDFKKASQTVTPTVEETTPEIDPVTQYVLKA